MTADNCKVNSKLEQAISANTNQGQKKSIFTDKFLAAIDEATGNKGVISYDSPDDDLEKTDTGKFFKMVIEEASCGKNTIDIESQAFAEVAKKYSFEDYLTEFLNYFPTSTNINDKDLAGFLRKGLAFVDMQYIDKAELDSTLELNKESLAKNPKAEISFKLIDGSLSAEEANFIELFGADEYTMATKLYETILSFLEKHNLKDHPDYKKVSDAMKELKQKHMDEIPQKLKQASS
jgi:hypothetical protein